MKETPMQFLARAGNYGRIVSSVDLTSLQITEFQAKGLFFVDPETNFGYAVVPWELTTMKDRKREEEYFIGKHRSASESEVHHRPGPMVGFLICGFCKGLDGRHYQDCRAARLLSSEDRKRVLELMGTGNISYCNYERALAAIEREFEIKRIDAEE